MDRFEDRLARLERDNRRLRLMCLAALVGGSLAVALGVGQPGRVPDVVQARRFEVLDAEGVSVIQLESSSLGGIIRARNSRGVSVVQLRCSELGGVLRVTSDLGETLFEAAPDKAGQGRAGVYTLDGDELVVLGAGEGHRGTVTTFGPGKRELVALAAAETGQGTVVVTDGRGVELLRLGAGADGNGSVRLNDRRGEPMEATGPGG